MTKRTRKAPKRKASGTHKKRANTHHDHDEAVNFDMAPIMDTRILTDGEKHKLIRAHTETRSVRKGFGMGYYTAVIMCCLVVGGGWLATLQWNFGLFAGHQDPAIQTVQESIESFRNNAALRIPEAEESFKEARAKLGHQSEAQNGIVEGVSSSTKN